MSHLPPRQDVTLWVVWLMARLVALSALTLPRENTVTSDVVLYHQWSQQAWQNGLLPGRDYSWEYPPGAFPFVALPFPIRSLGTYTSWFVIQCLVVDAIVLIALRSRARRTGSEAGVWLWVLGVPALGPLAFLRLDLIPVALVLVALVMAEEAPRRAGALLAVATTVKLWPGVVLLAALRMCGRRKELVVAFFVTAFATFGAASALGFGGSLSTSLRVQSERGVQVEALSALPWLWARAAGAPVQLAFRHFATEIDSDTSAKLGLAWSVIVVAVLLWLLLRARPAPGLAALSLPAASVGLLLIGNKVFSPQYLLWLLGLTALVACQPHRHQRALVYTCFLVVVVTHAVFPFGYEQLLARDIVPLLLLTLRDALLLGLAALLVSNARSQLPEPFQDQPSAAPRA